MNRSGNARGYALSRNALIDAVVALREFPRGSFVLVGAQAVYLRAPEPIASVPAFTFDGDLVANPSMVGRPRYIYERLAGAGFELRGQLPGLYVRSGVVPDDEFASHVDILVPAVYSHAWNLEGFNAIDARATLEQPGLEVALFDHSPLPLTGVDDATDVRKSVVIDVAGTVALLIAKGWKIGERFDDGPDAFSSVRKDVTDVFRLLRSSDKKLLETSLRALPQQPKLHEIAMKGAENLAKLCGDRAPGLTLLRRDVGESVEADLIVASLPPLVEEFYEIVRESTIRGEF